MAAEKVMRLEKTDLITEVTRRRDKSRLVPTNNMGTARRGPSLPWPLLAGQLGGKLQLYGREWTEFQITFPQGRAKQGGASI